MNDDDWLDDLLSGDDRLSAPMEVRERVIQRVCAQVAAAAALAVLDARWSRELAARPEARAAFEEDFARYAAWLRGQRAF